MSSDSRKSHRCNTKFHLTCTDSNPDHGKREVSTSPETGASSAPLQMVSGHSVSRTAAIVATLDDRTAWEASEPVWDYQKVVPGGSKVDNGTPAFTWSSPHQGGKPDIATWPITATVCKHSSARSQTVNIQIMPPGEMHGDLPVGDFLPTFGSELLRILQKVVKHTSHSIDGLDKTIPAHAENADVYNKPICAKNWTFNGSAEVVSTTDTHVYLSLVHLLNGALSEEIDINSSRGVKVTVEAKNFKHDWSLPHGTITEGWSGDLSLSGAITFKSTGKVKTSIGNVNRISDYFILGCLIDLGVIGKLQTATKPDEPQRMSVQLGINKVELEISGGLRGGQAQRFTRKLPVELGLLESNFTIGNLDVPDKQWESICKNLTND